MTPCDTCGGPQIPGHTCAPQWRVQIPDWAVTEIVRAPSAMEAAAGVLADEAEEHVGEKIDVLVTPRYPPVTVYGEVYRATRRLTLQIDYHVAVNLVSEREIDPEVPPSRDLADPTCPLCQGTGLDRTTDAVCLLCGGRSLDPDPDLSSALEE